MPRKAPQPTRAVPASKTGKIRPSTPRAGVLLNLSSAAAAILASTRRNCHWPSAGHVHESGFEFCGAPAVEGKPYCAYHLGLASARR